MDRVTVEDVRLACERTGFKLNPGTSITIEPARMCGCPLAILCRSTDASTSVAGSIPMAISHLGLDADYGWGIVKGFDYNVGESPDPDWPARMLRGFGDGQAIRKAAAAGGLPSL